MANGKLKADLNQREIEILNLRLRRITLDQIGKKLGISAERVRQLEVNAIRKLLRAGDLQT